MSFISRRLMPWHAPTSTGISALHASTWPPAHSPRISSPASTARCSVLQSPRTRPRHTPHTSSTRERPRPPGPARSAPAHSRPGHRAFKCGASQYVSLGSQSIPGYHRRRKIRSRRVIRHVRHVRYVRHVSDATRVMSHVRPSRGACAGLRVHTREGPAARRLLPPSFSLFSLSPLYPLCPQRCAISLLSRGCQLTHEYLLRQQINLYEI